MLAINKVSTKSIKYHTKLCAYDTTYDTKPSIGMINYATYFNILPKRINDNLCKHTKLTH